MVILVKALVTLFIIGIGVVTLFFFGEATEFTMMDTFGIVLLSILLILIFILAIVVIGLSPNI